MANYRLVTNPRRRFLFVLTLTTKKQTDKLLEGKTMADIASFLLVGTVGTVIKIFAEPLIKDIKATLFTASQNLANDTAMKITILPLETASEVQPQQRGIVLGFDNVNQLIILLKN